LIRVGDEGLDYLGAFLDASTNYFTHTGTQSVATMLIEEAIAEAPRELGPDAPVVGTIPIGLLKKRQTNEREALKRRHERERDELKLRHDHQRQRLKNGFWEMLEDDERFGLGKLARRGSGRRRKATRRARGRGRGRGRGRQR